VLDSTGLAKAHNLTKEEVSCEAIRDLMSVRVEFDDINWFAYCNRVFILEIFKFNLKLKQVFRQTKAGIVLETNYH